MTALDVKIMTAFSTSSNRKATIVAVSAALLLAIGCGCSQHRRPAQSLSDRFQEPVRRRRPAKDDRAGP